MCPLSVSDYIPYDSIAYILISDELTGGVDIFSGTGFFAFVPETDIIFFITAYHTVFKNDNNDLYEKIKITLKNDSDLTVVLSECITGSYTNDHTGVDDVALFLVEPRSKLEQEILFNRAIRLQNQDDVNWFLEYCLYHNENVKVVGYPTNSKNIDYGSLSLIHI